MGVVWSSPCRWQILVICLGLLVLSTGFVLLLLSIGFENDKWRLVGGVSASMGSALVVTGTCWCVWVVRRGRFTDGLALTVPESEAETLTNDAAWRTDFGEEEDGYDDESDVDDEDDVDDDDDDDDDDAEEGGEEEESEEADYCEADDNDVTSVQNSYENRGNKSKEIKTERKRSTIEDDEESCLIPV